MVHQKILVVEDEEALSLALKDSLVREDFDITLAKNGEEGLATALREKPDLILLDILMPKMDGMTMLMKLRQAEGVKKTPVFLLTVLPADDKIMEGVVRDEPAYYLVKTDFTIADIIEKIRTIPGFEK